MQKKVQKKVQVMVKGSDAREDNARLSARTKKKRSSHNGSVKANEQLLRIRKKPGIYRRIINKIHRAGSHIHGLHKMRKNKDEPLPEWKDKWNHFNETKLGFIERGVEKSIPWLVIVLIMIIIGEFSTELNVFSWKWLYEFGLLYHSNLHIMDAAHNVIVAFFVADLYFNFFKKSTFWTFFKSSFVDILAVAPLGILFRITGIGRAQTMLNIALDAGEASRMIQDGETVVKYLNKGTMEILHAEQVMKIIRVNQMTRFTRLLRLLRLHNLKDLPKPDAIKPLGNKGIKK